jgi:hypothetical protein
MYQFSRAIYRELSPHIPPVSSTGRDAHAEVLRACERTVERLATDRHYFAKPARTLFNDVRVHFPMASQERVWRIVSTYVGYAQEWVASQPERGYDVNGNPLECRATTRRGTACQRAPLPHNGYCPSHQHLAETEEIEHPIAA